MQGLDRCGLSLPREHYDSPWNMLVFLQLVQVFCLGFDVGIPSRLNAYTILTIVFPRGHNLNPPLLYLRKLVTTYMFANALKQVTFCSSP